MSHSILQRVVVRMLHDPGFALRVYEDPQESLRELPLNESHWDLLTRPDPRAYQADALRSSRVMAGLVEEFLASVGLLVRHDGGPERLERYFSSSTFHQAVQDGSSLAASFGHWLASSGAREPRLAPLARLEAAIAKVRRRQPHAEPGAPGSLVLAARVELVELPEGSLRLRQELLSSLLSLGPSASEAALDPRTPLGPPADWQPRSHERLLLEERRGEVSVEELPDALFEVLDAARSPQPADDLRCHLQNLGAEAGEDAQILQGLVDDGLLEIN